MASTESNILELIRVSGGEISLSLLKDQYRNRFGHDIGAPTTLKFRDWVSSFSSIGIKKGKGLNDIAVYDKRPLKQVDLTEKIRRLIREAGGEISLSYFRYRYNEVYNEHLDIQGSLKGWITSFPSFKTKRVGSDYFAYESGAGAVNAHVPAAQQPSSNPQYDAIHTDYSTSRPQIQCVPVLSLFGEANDASEGDASDFFSVPEENTDEPVSSQDIIAKLKSYGDLKPIVVHQDSESLLNILPYECSMALRQIGMEHISDIVFDLGRMPYCWVNNRRHYFFDDGQTVQDRDIEDIAASLQDFGDDNRAGINGQLHRISSIRNNRNNIIGLTIRVGRYVEGNADMIRDLLEDEHKSILLLGEVNTTIFLKDFTLYGLWLYQTHAPCAPSAARIWQNDYRSRGYQDPVN